MSSSSIVPDSTSNLIPKPTNSLPTRKIKAHESHEQIVPILNPDRSIWKYVSRTDIARFIKGKIPEEVAQDEVVFRDREGHWIMIYTGEKAEMAKKYLKDNGLDLREELSKEKRKMEGF
ncbi:hypothetical protein L486_05854 [Kwoniella mangroviensis CBS 10435]|uniref:Uncharacterized protein n=1 Tax=Kwoniella mangroviensis CBS 10435 TaxID=1331196 RepID=A0A1B9IN91_9TREE|nr:hypothetical protein L486_05854 [Kwoniella mangroviensis CBS 10435]